MSAPCESAASPAPCACTNISLMQLFHELKQKFPGVPDHVVSNTIELYCHDKQACEKHLHTEVKASLTHAYHASSSAAARHLSQLRLNPPLKCKNQPIVKHEISKPTAIKSTTCIGPQKAILCSDLDKADKLNTDANQNIVEARNEETIRNNNSTSPVTVINIDNCHVKYNADSPSDLELTNDNTKENKPNNCTRKKSIPGQTESTNYKINRSNKINSNLNERLERGKEKKTIKKEEVKQELKPEVKQELKPEVKQELKPEVKQEFKPEVKQELKPEVKQELKPEVKQVLKPEVKREIKQETQQELKREEPPLPEKPKRPNTLDFIKPNPDTAFKQTLKNPESEFCGTVSPAPDAVASDTKEPKGVYRSERGYPLNVSVNVNCHMDLSRGYGEPWLEEYDSGGAITSVNLTVCTPTSSMASPEREREGFEGHVTVTVSPSSARAPRRRAPPPPPPHRPLTPPAPSDRGTSPRPSRAAPEPPTSTYDRSLIERQKERFNRLATALAQEKGRLEQLNKETAILAGGVPSPSAARRLREYVERLRDQCDVLAKRLEMAGNERDDSGNFYSNIYTGQRPPSSWQCHMCTFRNHPLLDKCEECDMPRIIVVRARDGITVRLMPGRRKITRSWVL